MTEDTAAVPAPQLVCETCGMAEDEPCPMGEPRPHNQHSTIACREYHPFKAAVPAPAAPSPVGSVADARRVVLDHFYALGAYPDLEVGALIAAIRDEESAKYKALVEACDAVRATQAFFSNTKASREARAGWNAALAALHQQGGG